MNFGRYEIEGEIGRGAAGIVYRARDVELDRRVALKVLHDSRPSMLERFHREALAAARLRHPGIVAVHDAGMVDGTPFIAMDLVDGEPMDLSRGSLRTRVAALAKVADAVAHAHREGIVHRDLKPGNVLVDRTGEPRLVDFGLARARDLASLTRSGAVIGTPIYMSPEQVCAADVGPATDVYSLGVMLYEALAGRPPFDGESIEQLFHRILTHDASPPAGAPAELSAVCLKAIDRDARRRYAHAGALADDLRRWLAGEPVQARPPSASVLVWRFVRRRRAALAMGAGVAFGLAVVGVPLALRARARAADEARIASIERELDGLRARRRTADFRFTDADLAAVRSRADGVPRTSVRGWHVVARCREAAGDATGAEQAYESALTLDPQHRPTLAALGHLRLERALVARSIHRRGALGRDAVDEAKAAVAMVERAGDPHASDLARAYLRVIENWDRNERVTFEAERATWDPDEFLLLEGAAGRPEAYEELVALAPSWHRAYLWRGTVRRERKAAIADYTKAIDIHPRFVEAYSNRALARKDDGDLEGAIADATRAIEIDPRFAVAWFNRGLARYVKGDLEGAIDDYRRAIEANPRYGAPYNNRGATKFLRGDFDGAIADCTRAIDLDPESADAYVNRSTVRREAGDLKGALNDANRAMELDAGRGGAYNARGLVRAMQGDARGAREDYDRAIGLDPRHAEAYVNRANVREDAAGAVDDCTRAIEINPRMAAAYVNRGIARRRQKQFDEAIADHTRAIEIEPGLAEAYYNRGSVRLDTGDAEGAVRDYGLAIERRPRLAQAWLDRARARLRLGDRAGARADLEQVIALAPAGSSPAATARQWLEELNR